jgi:hypothetical protein
MIKKYLSNKNENATMSKSKNFWNLNKALATKIVRHMWAFFVFSF